MEKRDNYRAGRHRTGLDVPRPGILARVWRRLPTDFARGSRTSRALGSMRREIDVVQRSRARYVWRGSKGAGRACLTILTGETCAVVQLVKLDRVNTHGNDHNAKKRPAIERASRSGWVFGLGVADTFKPSESNRETQTGDRGRLGNVAPNPIYKTNHE